MSADPSIADIGQTSLSVCYVPGSDVAAHQIWQPSGRSAVVVPLVPILRVPPLDHLPMIGEALFAQSPHLFYGPGDRCG